MIKEATGYGSTIEEARENAVAALNAAPDADIQFDVVATPKKKTMGLFGGRKAEVRVFIELPDEKPKKAKKNDKKEEAKKPAKAKAKPMEEKKEAAKKAEEKKESIYDGYSEPVSADSLEKDSKAAKAVAYIRTILAALNCGEVAITVAEKENAALISLEGEDLGVIIGRRGETLDAVQYLASLAANNGGGYYKVSLNIGNYREKREEALISLAK
ncbi:MAG: KH domain-containing protein, partial [Clostridia bacterium]|nr:KH domain-containing protein [Clostridia bacterium]